MTQYDDQPCYIDITYISEHIADTAEINIICQTQLMILANTNIRNLFWSLWQTGNELMIFSLSMCVSAHKFYVHINGQDAH